MLMEIASSFTTIGAPYYTYLLNFFLLCCSLSEGSLEDIESIVEVTELGPLELLRLSAAPDLDLKESVEMPDMRDCSS